MRVLESFEHPAVLVNMMRTHGKLPVQARIAPHQTELQPR